MASSFPVYVFDVRVGGTQAAPPMRAATVISTMQWEVCSCSTEGTASRRGAFSLAGRAEDDLMPRKVLLTLLFTGSLGVMIAQAQTAVPDRQPRADCPPGVGTNAPSVGRDAKGNLSDQLAASKGVICPPADVDPEMQQRPPEGGAMKVIPPPGSPGGNPNVQPK